MKTGPSWAQKAARTLSRSTTVQVPGIGHWVVPQAPCAQKVLASFLARPTAPDTGCLAGSGGNPSRSPGSDVGDGRHPTGGRARRCRSRHPGRHSRGPDLRWP
ncbi:alpha/beta hydrolase [Streptomyces sp. NPDC086989]|uniref:alpha/beta hydrolase n=1 Tax=Streptomyces sp. NPDC086989 TaxID=3365764 RepID=UPI0037F57A75